MIMLRGLLLVLTIVAVLGFVEFSDASDSSVTGENSAFVAAALQDGLIEIELGKLALNKSTDQDVKKFANTMVRDHSQANAELEGIAQHKGLKISASLNAHQAALVRTMSTQDSAAFNTGYAKHMVSDHDNAIALFQAAAASADPEISGFARQTLPQLQRHKKMAEQLVESTGPFGSKL